MTTISRMNSSGGGTVRAYLLFAVLAVLAAACGSAEPNISSEPETSVETESSTQAPGSSQAPGSTQADGNGDGDGDGRDTTSTEDEAAADREKSELYAQEFSECMRDQGVEIPNLEINADGSLDVDALIQNVDPQDPAIQQAMLACRSTLGGKLEGALAQFLTSDTFEDVLVGFSDCVRNDGYDVKDLTLNAIVGAMLSGGAGNDPRTIDGGFGPIAANALGLDPADADVLSTIDGCAVDVQAGLAELNLGALTGDS